MNRFTWTDMAKDRGLVHLVGSEILIVLRQADGGKEQRAGHCLTPDQAEELGNKLIDAANAARSANINKMP